MISASFFDGMAARHTLKPTLKRTCHLAQPCLMPGCLQGIRL